jgi:hypothetical protein
MRRSRHCKPVTKPDFAIRATPRSLGILRLFDHYRILPLNWMYALSDSGNYTGYRDLCTRMCQAGFLERKTLNGARNNNETQSYLRTKAGAEYLHGLGFAALLNDTHTDAHQSLIDITEAQIEIGARAHAVEYHSWLDVRDHSLTPKLPDNPFRFDVGGSYQTPDGRPFYLKNANRQSALFLREIDRDHEKRETILVKLRNYKLLHEAIKQRYGFKQVLLLFITTNQPREQKILQWIGEVFPEGCLWIMTSTMQDHIKDCLSTPPIAAHLFSTPYQRAGYPRFSLPTLSDVP